MIPRSIFYLLGIVTILSACAPTISPSSLQSMATFDLCDAIQTNLHASRANASNASSAQEKADQGIAELRRRADFSDEEIKAIENSEVSTGMSAQAARCSWGKPYNINRFSTARGPAEQWSFNNCLSPSCSRANYLYILGGVVDQVAN